MKIMFKLREVDFPLPRISYFVNACFRYVIRVLSKILKMRSVFGRWRIYRCQIIGVTLLCIQCVLLTFLLYAFLPSSSMTHSGLLEDAHEASAVFSSFGTPVFVIGKELLQKGGATRVGWNDKAPFAAQFENVATALLIAEKLQEAGFETVVFYNQKISKFPPEEKTIPIGVALKKKYPFYISFLHSRIDNFWWRGAVLKDSDLEQKLSDSDLYEKDLVTVLKEGIYKKAELVKGTLGGHAMILPRNVKTWINSSDSDYEFVECDYRKAHSFLMEFKRKFDDTNRFQHKAWKVLSRTQVIMDRLKIPFWLSSGTCLGYYRECGIIPYTTDVDIGVFAKDYSENIIKEFVFRGFYLKHIFGKPNDSYELSFISGGVKVDIFFFYEEGSIMWNGGTQRSTGKKFKYVFPRFDICWTEFMDLLVRVPCNTTSYIEANYGLNWVVPKEDWVWHKSPSNILDNGYWPRKERKDVIQVFRVPEFPF